MSNTKDAPMEHSNTKDDRLAKLREMREALIADAKTLQGMIEVGTEKVSICAEIVSRNSAQTVYITETQYKDVVLYGQLNAYKAELQLVINEIRDIESAKKYSIN